MIFVCGAYARRAGKLTDAIITVSSTFIAALLALATYLYGVQSNDDATRDRLQHLLVVEVLETRKAVEGNATRWHKVESTGEGSPAVYYTFAPRIVAMDAFKSGLFPSEEELLLQYLLAIENYNKVVETHLSSLSMGTIPGGASSGLVSRIVLSGADAVDKRAIELLSRLRTGKGDADKSR